MRSAGSIIARASSGSRSAISSVEPLMSAKRAVTVLRSLSSDPWVSDASGSIRISAVLSGVGAEPVEEGTADEWSPRPHLPQNLAAEMFSKPHEAHDFLNA